MNTSANQLRAREPQTADTAVPGEEVELTVADVNREADNTESVERVSEADAARGTDDVGADTSAAESGTARFDATGDAALMPEWDELVREHADRVYRLAYRLSGNQHDAEDLTQETFIRVFRSLSSYRAGTFEGWLHRITTNLFLDMVRRRNKIRMEALPEDYERVPGNDPNPEQIYHDANLDPDLQNALDSLAPEFRAAVVLCDIEGLSYEEIAATLGVKLGTVRSRIHRGRQAIRDHLATSGHHSGRSVLAHDF
jgi:RNA polymerase sigma-70 factor (ECF subfamily)